MKMTGEKTHFQPKSATSKFGYFFSGRQSRATVGNCKRRNDGESQVVLSPGRNRDGRENVWSQNAGMIEMCTWAQRTKKINCLFNSSMFSFVFSSFRAAYSSPLILMRTMFKRYPTNVLSSPSKNSSSNLPRPRDRNDPLEVNPQ